MRLLAIGVTQDSGAARAPGGGVQLVLAEGELHALLGPDGVGKSALVQILGGVRKPGRGLLLLDGQPYAPASPGEARRAGVWVAGRGATLADGLTVEENLVLGAEPSRRGWIDRELRRAQAVKALADLPGSAIPPCALAGALSLADRRRVEIARALLAPPKVLLVEEAQPLAAREGSVPFFAALRRLAFRGTAILYATRSLETARALCTRYTFLREEGTAASGRIWGNDLEAFREAPFPRLPRRRGRPLLLAREGVVLHEGEILGLADSGGFQPFSALPGRVAVGRGGILPGLSIADNLTLAALRRFSQWGFLSLVQQDATALDWMEKLHLWARTPRQDVAELRPADRQKVLLGQLLLEGEKVLCLEAPTMGLTRSAQREIHALLQSIAAEGRGILLASPDSAELLALCDTIALLRRGLPVDCRPVAQWTERELAAALLDSGPKNAAPRRGERSTP